MPGPRPVVALAFLAALVLARPARAQEAPASSGQSPSTATASDGSDARRLWGYVAIGTGGAALFLGGYAFVQARSAATDERYEEFRQTVKQDEGSVCDVAKSRGEQDVVDLCDDHAKWNTVAWVALPIGVLATATGVVLLTTGPSRREASRLRVAPAVGPRAGWVDVSYRF